MSAKYYVSGKIKASEVRDGYDRVLPMLPSNVTGRLIFVDFEPEANWSHRCWYVFIGDDGSYSKREHTEPPHMSLLLTEV